MAQNNWNDQDDARNGASDEQSWRPELSPGDPERWRGDAHAPLDDGSWRGTDQASCDDNAWLGDDHAEEWPEWNAGPEYHMWKRIEERESE